MSELSTGTRIGDYEILREIGRGGMGVVYEAREAALGRTVALKILPVHLASNPEYIERFRKEARLIGQLNHPNIVTIHGIGIHENLHFIVMEHVKGRDLSQILEGGAQLPVGFAFGIASQVAAALSAAHRLKIIHRDIKPQNIMVDPNGRVKVMDFGIAKWVGESVATVTSEGTLIGTPAYMSREQCLGGQLDGRSDLYSLGVVLYQMLTGALPHTGENAAVVIQKILNEIPAPVLDSRPDVPRPAAAVVERLMAKDAEGRYATADEACADLRQYGGEDSGAALGAIGELVTQVITPMPTERITRKTAMFLEVISKLARRRTVAFAAGSLVVLLAALFLSRGGRSVAPRVPQTPTLQFAASAVPVPEIEWDEAPADGAPVHDPQVRLAWRVKNDAVAEGFLIGLNDLNPKVKIAETSKSFDLVAAGSQIVKIIPIGSDGAKGEPLIAMFNYHPEHAPELAVADSEPPPRPDLGASPARVLRGIVKKSEETKTDEAAIQVTRTGASTSPSSIMDVDAAIRSFSGVDGKVAESAARQAILSAAQGTNPIAKMWAGWFYHWGRCGFAKDSERATAFTKMAIEKARPMAETGDPDAQFLLGAALDQGLLVKRDPERAAELVRQAADKNQTTAMNYLGWMYFEGRGFAKSNDEALKWFQAAAMRGDVNAMNNLGWMYLQGRGATKDSGQALAWFAKAADAGSPRAMSSLGWMYQEGTGVPRDDARALEWFRKAADAADPQALFVLASRHEEGRGVARDRARAIALYRQAASLGYEMAEKALARLERKG